MPFSEDVERLDIEKIGPYFETHERFPKKTNTEFVKIIDRSHVQMTQRMPLPHISALLPSALYISISKSASSDGLINEPIVVQGKEYKMTCVSMGNPHAVVFLEFRNACR